MKKIDKTVIAETKYVGGWVLMLSSLMQAVFLVMDKWDHRVFLGNALSGVAGVLSFFALGLTVVKAVSSGDSDYARKLMKASSALRIFFLFVVVLLGTLLPFLNPWATLIPMTFPRLALLIRSLEIKRMNKAAEIKANGEVDKLD